MQFNIFKLFNKTITILKKDKIIFVPYLAFFLISQSYQTFINIAEPDKDLTTFSFWTKLVILNWLVELFFKGLTIGAGIQILKKEEIDIINLIKTITKKYFKMILATAPFALPVIFISLHYFTSLKTLTAETGSNPEIQIIQILPILIILPLFLIIEFVPVIFLSENLSLKQSFFKTPTFVWKNIKKVFILSSFILLISFFILNLTVIFGDIPVIGESLLFALINGVGHCTVTTLYVVFYFFIKDNPIVDVEV